MVGLLLVPNDPGASLSGPVDLDDGSRAYVLVSDEPGRRVGRSCLWARGPRHQDRGSHRLLDMGVRVTAQGLDGETRDFLTISYQGYDEPLPLSRLQNTCLFPMRYWRAGLRELRGLRVLPGTGRVIWRSLPH